MHHDPVETLSAYVAAFETADPDLVAPFYHSPCLFVAPFGVSLAADPEAARRTASALVAHARSLGYRRTETSRVERRSLASNLVEVTGVFVRFDGQDREIGRFGFTYVLREDGTGWKIVVAVAHDVPPSSDPETPDAR